MVRTIKLNDGKSIPALAWGNGTGGIEHSGQKAIDTGVVALEAGILHIDTAQVRPEKATTTRRMKTDRTDIWY
jgi:diketogulonate reductase-like aldo/keto reductase